MLIKIRGTIDYKIPIGKMPESSGYVKLHQKSKYFQNIIKMICYRAETALANKLTPRCSRAEHEVGALIKAITNLTVDLSPDQEDRI